MLLTISIAIFGHVPAHKMPERLKLGRLGLASARPIFWLVSERHNRATREETLPVLPATRGGAVYRHMLSKAGSLTWD